MEFKYKRMRKRKSVENDYDSDVDIVRKAKTKMQRELRLGILNYLEKAPRSGEVSLKWKPHSA